MALNKNEMATRIAYHEHLTNNVFDGINDGKPILIFDKKRESYLLEKANAGGFTVQPFTGDEPSEGFATLVFPKLSVVVASGVALSDNVFRDFVNTNSNMFGDLNYFGAWNTGNGIVLGISVVNKTIESATKIALANDQHSIYDLKTGEKI